MSYFVHPAEARRQFSELAAGEITNENLAQASLLIALEEYPQLNVEEYLQKLDALANRVMARRSSGDPPIFRLGHLHAEMFDSDGYGGNADAYYDPRNAFLNDVIDRKIGLPISLSIIFLHVASRAGLSAFGVGLPGHYLVKVQFELNEVYVDPFRNGETLTMPEIAELLTSISGGRVKLASEHLRSWTGRQTLVRVLGNLEGMWGRLGEPRKAASARERIEILQQSSP